MDVKLGKNWDIEVENRHCEGVKWQLVRRKQLFWGIIASDLSDAIGFDKLEKFGNRASDKGDCFVPLIVCAELAMTH